ncbi:MAG: RagB/SusD family nutrient uptake outer membrane protein [Rikenellaceae bacterium]
MKNIIKNTKVIGALLLASFSFSCEGFLDETNYSSKTADTLFATEDGYESLVNGMYSYVRTFYNTGSYYNLMWLGTDMMTQGSNSSITILNQYYNFTNDNSDVYTVWTNAYTALKACNAVIERADAADIDDSTRAQRVAEGKGLRALFLFELVKTWGDVPLMNYEVKEVSYESQRDPASEIYAQIISDLTDAIAVLPATQTTDYGRFSASAARHLRAKVYLTRAYQSYADSSDFANAYADATTLINAGNHTLLSDFAMVHRQANEENNEIIFAAQWSTDATVGLGNSQYRYFAFDFANCLGGAKSNEYGNVTATYVPTKLTYMLFDWENDARARTTFMSSYNGSASTSTDGGTYGKNWYEVVDPIGTLELGEAALIFPTPAYSATPDASLIDEQSFTLNFPTGDVTDFSYGVDGENDYWKLAGQLSESTHTSASARTFLPIWKFKDGNTYFLESGSSTGTRDTYLFRLAETYLIASEAALQQGDNTNALKYLNALRERAEINSGSLVYPAGTTVDIDMILDEGILELVGEVSRWSDLQRTGKLAERVLKYNWDTNNITGGLSTNLTSGDTKYQLRPIPLTWINSLSNGSEIVNNPGW